MKYGVALLLIAALVGVVGAPAGAPAVGERHLLLVSLDGLRPEFYLDDSYEAPELRALVRTGSHARAAEGVFPSVTYPSHASIVTGVRPARHGILFNVLFDPIGSRGRWYEEASDLRAPPLWEWAQSAGLRTAGVSWPSTLGARIDLLLPERDYYARRDPVDLLRAAVTPGLLDRLGLVARPETFGNVIEWDAFLAAAGAAIIRDARPHLLMIHLVQLDYFQHRGGPAAAEVKPALVRVDAHLATLRRALEESGLAPRTIMVVTGDHGFQGVERTLYPNEMLAAAGLRGCPRAGDGWRATVHIAGGSAAVFVAPAGDAGTARLAEAALRGAAGKRLIIVSREQLDGLGAMSGAAFAIEAATGFDLSGSCTRSATQRETAAIQGGTHGFLPSRPTMVTGFVVAGPGVRAGVSLDRIRLIDIAPTAARLLRIAAPAVEGRVVEEILQ